MFLRKRVLACQPRKIMWVMETDFDMYMIYFIVYKLRYHFVIVIFDFIYIILFVFHVMMVEIESWLLDAVTFKQFQLVNNQYDAKCGLWLWSNLWFYGMIILHCPNFSYYVLCILINTPWKQLTWFNFIFVNIKAKIFFPTWRWSLISILILQ